MIKATIFDLDGTLTNSLELLANLTNDILVSFGLDPYPVDRYKQFVGNGIGMLVERVLGSSNLHLKNEFIDILLSKMTDPTNSLIPLYDGIADLLDSLTEMNISLNVLSNKPQSACSQIEEKTFSKWHFSNFLGHSAIVPHKPDPYGVELILKNLNLTPDECMFIGDSGMDMKVATLSSVYPVGVLWGFRTQEELLDYGASSLIKHPSQLLPLIKKLS